MRRCRAARPTCCGRPSRRRSRRRSSGGAPLVRAILLVASRILLVASSPGRRPIGEWRATEPPRPARPSAANSKTAFQPRSRTPVGGYALSYFPPRCVGFALRRSLRTLRHVHSWMLVCQGVHGTQHAGLRPKQRRAGAARRTADTETYSRDTDRGVRITRLMVGITIDRYE